ncbi:hypothetical protein JOQ06_004680, partial [Pogonophryne albipinna]
TPGPPITHPPSVRLHPGLDYTSQLATLSQQTVLAGAWAEGMLEVVAECTAQLFHLGTSEGEAG